MLCWKASCKWHPPKTSHLISTPVFNQVQELTAQEPALILFSGDAFNPSLLSTVTKVSWLLAQPENCMSVSWSFWCPLQLAQLCSVQAWQHVCQSACATLPGQPAPQHQAPAFCARRNTALGMQRTALGQHAVL